MANSATKDSNLPLVDNGVTKAAPTGSERRGLRLLFLLPVLVLVFMAGAIVGLYFQPPGLQALFRTTGLQPGAGTDTPIAVAVQQVTEGEQLAVVSEGDVVALGRILPLGDISTVSPPFGSGDARIAALKVNAGDPVEQGTILAELDSLPQLRAQLETARANAAVAEATLAQTEKTTRIAQEEAQAALDRALATETEAREALERTTALLERGVTTRASLDTAIARATEAARDVERQRATLSRFLTEEGGRQADIAVAEANLRAARAQVAQAEIDLEKGYVRAPITGTVLDVRVQPGERPGSDGILDLGDISQMTVEAEVYQTLIGRVAVGDPVTVTAAAFEGELAGQVSAIGLEIGRQSITSDDPAANTDARVVDVVVTLDPESSARAARLTNLQVVARIDAGRAAE